MKIRPRQLMIAVASVVVAMLVLSTVTQVAAAVVCVGFNGHIDIESLLVGCCNTGISDGRTDAAGLSLGNSACSGCTDVQLKEPPLTSKETHLSHPDLDSRCIACSLGCGDDRSALSAGVADHMDQHSQSLVQLASVVLRT